MGLFCGKICKCKRRCKSYFSDMPDVERGCRNACKGDSGMNRERYLCSGKYIDERQYMMAYGHDPCPGNNITLAELLDPLDSESREDAKVERLTPLLAGLGAIILVAIVAAAWSIKSG